MNDPIIIEETGFQKAWIEAIAELKRRHWNLWDLMVRINDPSYFDATTNEEVAKFNKANGLLTPRQVSYTIFPDTLARRCPSHNALRAYYIYKMIPKLRKLEKWGWGTYFYRMVNYEIAKDHQVRHVDQLGNIIAAINESDRIMQAAYTMVICKPGGENTRPLGGPCLNSIAIQQERLDKNQRRISLLALYRNHDFLERAYGNYLGLCRLLKYICAQTQSEMGNLTCVSSHAYVDKRKTELIKFVSAF